MSRQEQIKPQKDNKHSKFKNLSCRFCNSKHIIKRGQRKTSTGKQRGSIKFCPTTGRKKQGSRQRTRSI